METPNQEVETKFVVRFREQGMWFDVTKEPVSKEEAADIYNKNTYWSMLWCKPTEEIFFDIKEVTII